MAIKKHKYYISGKISGLEESVALKKFNKIEEMYRGAGTVINPFKIKANQKKGLTWEQYMANDIKELLKCDVIIMLDNWGNSRGARIERAIAIELGLQIIYV